MFERCLYFNVNALSREVNRIWGEVFDQFELSPAHAYLIRLVLENPGITQQGIAAELKLEKSTVTRFVAILEQREFLYRKKEGREQLVYPAKSSKAIQLVLEQQGDELYKRMTDNLGKKVVVDMVKNLRNITAKIK